MSMKKGNAFKHGLSGNRIYFTWHSMKNRCYNEKNIFFHKYGKAGIKVCDEWNNSLVSFYNWAVNNGYSDNLTIDRIDNYKGYEPNNCRWVSRAIQSRNIKPIRVNNTSGYKGVSFIKERNRFAAQITVNGKGKRIGRYKTAIEAAIAYDEYVISNNLEHSINNIKGV